MLSKRSRVPLCALVVTLLAQAGYVQDGAPANPGKPYQYTVPEATNDGWETAHVSSENIDAELHEAEAGNLFLSFQTSTWWPSSPAGTTMSCGSNH